MKTVLLSIHDFLILTMHRVSGRMAAGWMLIGILAFLSCYMVYRKEALSKAAAIEAALFVWLMSAVYLLTLFVRKPSANYRYKRELFWSYRAIREGRTSLIGENFWNVVMFIPIGILLLLLLKRVRAVLAAGFLLSLSIELIQLVAKRGLFEFDDIFHNMLGTVLAIGIVRICGRCILRP